MIREIEKFFEDRKAVISKHSLCQEAGITTQLLGMIFRGERKLTEEVENKLLPVLKKYGFQPKNNNNMYCILENKGNKIVLPSWELFEKEGYIGKVIFKGSLEECAKQLG